MLNIFQCRCCGRHYQPYIGFLRALTKNKRMCTCTYDKGYKIKKSRIRNETRVRE